MEQLFGYFIMLAILSVLIIVHEFGHFSVARFFGFQTPVFGFGLPFGPHWTVGRKWGTEFRIHACLLGGYVAIPELGDESSSGQEAFGVPLKPFKKFPIWQRALVAFAGVGFNIIFAYFVMVAMLGTLGQQEQPIVAIKLMADNPIAEKAGIKAGDVIASIDEKRIGDPNDAVEYLRAHPLQTVQVHVLRDNQSVTIPVTPNSNGKVGMMLEGKGPVTYHKIDGGFLHIAQLAWVQLWGLTYSMIDALGQMFGNIFHGAKSTPGHPAMGIQDLHGVLAVVKIGADIVGQDWSRLFIFTVMISMDLAIINLLPWPALDGGHLAFMLFEAVRGRPMGERAQGEIVKWGFLSLILLMAVIMVNDVTAWYQGKLDIKKKPDAQSDTSKPPAKEPGAKEPGSAPVPAAPTSNSAEPAPAPAK